MPERIYTMPEDDKHVSENLVCAQGDTVKVELPSTPSTGYMWELDALPEGVHCLSQHFLPAEGRDPEMVGAGGTDVWTFKVRDLTGWKGIDFGMRRVWIDDEPPVRTCSLVLMPRPFRTKE